ncbi:MAG: hypothetical protein Q8L34_02700 [Candidatus Woesearchaeota archaeon]|nr:hypothetical protein [Candidatus Woesearchaeota archaeon]
MTEPLERFEQDLIRRLSKLIGKRIVVDDGGLSFVLEALPGNQPVSTEGTLQSVTVVDPITITNYAATQREADRLNKTVGKQYWAGCTCGRLHERDPSTGHVNSGWY